MYLFSKIKTLHNEFVYNSNFTNDKTIFGIRHIIDIYEILMYNLNWKKNLKILLTEKRKLKNNIF